MSYRPKPTWALVEPPPAVEIAADLLAVAAAAIETQPDPTASSAARKATERRQLSIAHAAARAIDWTAFQWFWTEGGREWERRHVNTAHQDHTGPKASSTIPPNVQRAVVDRDGYRCRYCQIRVVTAAALRRLELLLPAALPVWPSEMGPAALAAHAAECVLQLTWDHVTPRAFGGPNTADNIVVSCGTCNYSKGSCTLDELSLRSPFDRAPLPQAGWGGLDGRLGAKRL